MMDSNQSRDPHVIVVLPYLNEQATLFETCNSLGFGTGPLSTVSDTTLILVDNNSTDNSSKIAHNIQELSREASVITEFEEEKGYVPPRHHGNLIARNLCLRHGWNEDKILILQADADVQYPEDYIESMRLAAQLHGTNTLIEGCITYPVQFQSEHPGYIDLCQRTDHEFEDWFVDESDDVLVVDSVTGYYLSDYFNWGEHRREFTSDSQEIHAETTRLYIRAKAKGATRFRVETVVFHSPRKVLLDPGLHFATAGFPRETSWKEKWHSIYKGPRALADFYKFPLHSDVQKAIRTRQQHLIALIGLLPLHVGEASDNVLSAQSRKLNTIVRSTLPIRTIEELRETPGKFITDVFKMMDIDGYDLLNNMQNR